MWEQVYTTICNFIDMFNNLLWGYGTFILICIIGMYFTIRIKFFNIIHLVHIFKTVFWGERHRSDTNKTGIISQFQALSTSLAASMGTGNIIGVAAAISMGGPGTIFWMWISAIFGTAIGFIENTLGGKYKETCGGPMSYISAAFRNPHAAGLYAVICVASSFGIGNLTQSNAISSAALNFNIDSTLSAILIFTSCIFVIFGGAKKVASAAEKLIPFTACFYLIGALFVIVIFGNNISEMLIDIFKSAFGFSQITGGICGTLLKKSITIGLRRGIFSNEAGMGSSVLVHSEAHFDHPVKMGMFAVAEIVIDTIICCTATAFVILLTNADANTDDALTMVTSGFRSVMGNFADIFISTATIIFAFCTLIGWYFYGEKCVKYLSKNGNSNSIFLYRIVYSASAFLGAISELKLVWGIADILNWFMLIFNLSAVIILHNEAIQEINNYTNSIIITKDNHAEN